MKKENNRSFGKINDKLKYFGITSIKSRLVLLHYEVKTTNINTTTATTKKFKKINKLKKTKKQKQKQTNKQTIIQYIRKAGLL